jgi:hypothetical protein
MGDLVVGLAKSAVMIALKKVQSAIEEAKLPQSAQRNLIFITGEFEMMLEFLNVAVHERVTNPVVRTWVRQVSELGYDLEDCIEFVVHMDRTNWWFILSPPCMKAPPQPLEMAVDEIEQLKARVEDVSRRNSQYNLISDSGSKPVLAQQQPPPRAAVEYDTGREHVSGDLTQLITKDDADLQVISLWGVSGGTETTSIIRRSYSDSEISHIFTCRAWVNLTRPFNPHNFVRSLMAQFYANSCQERQGAIIGIDVLTSMDASATQGDLLSEFVQLVDKNRYLVVLEDLSTMEEWDSIRTFLPDRKNGSWIIVSSQQYGIARLCVGHPYQVLDLNLNQWGQRSVCAFFREVNLKTPSMSVYKITNLIPYPIFCS